MMPAEILGVRLVTKHPEDLAKIPALDARLQWLLELASMWVCRNNAGVLMVTDVDTPGVHKAKCHYDKRAVDLSIVPLSLAHWERFADWLNQTLCFGQVSPDGRELVPVLVGKWDENGKHNDHVHLQVPGPYQAEGRIRLNAVSPPVSWWPAASRRRMP